ncbi:cell wall-binding repeat-containing protein [Jeotgalibacillus sp. ET6]|uniref:cell wall-binding repeat-containing protein n=1 Tax=Jeotgalibacillus sp. ET6 TaxID=3037260 RepID=UPI0024185F3F|nr:cell wall-binding repeat-containing protein [Jeotgalibacillus sp. ET6]MDG5471581.1 cell wall-binding repeat-containing protein [Jeotgalibacillus sp. ET6]
MKSKWGLVTSLALAGSLVVSQSAFANGDSTDQERAEPRMNKMEAGSMSETEPNNSVDQANLIEENSFVTGHLPADDTDYFTFEVTGDEAAYFVSTAYPNADTSDMALKLELYNSDKGEVVPDEEYGDDTGFYDLVTELEPGTYYLNITDENNSGEEEGYFLETSVFTDEPTIDRLSGKDRYATAVEIAKAGWFEGDTSELVLATGTDFPDALAASPLAYHLEAPILLTRNNSIPDVVEEAIEYFDPDHITIVGGSYAVSDGVQSYLEDTMGIETTRISGKDRYETAALIADELPGKETAYVVNGSNYPDALSIASYAAYMESPILLSRKNSLPSPTADIVGDYNDSWIIGGKGVVSTDVYRELPNPKRIGGKDRYETSVQVVKQLKMDASYASLATGQNFADALTGSVLSAQFGEPVLLTKKNSLPASVKNLFTDRGTFYYTIYGGTGVISENVVEELKSIN